MFCTCFGLRLFLSFLYRVGLGLESFIAHSYTCHSRAGGNPWIHKSPNLKKLWAPACGGVTGKGSGDSVSYQAAGRLIKTITSMAISLCLLIFSTPSPSHGSSSSQEILQEASPCKTLIAQCSPLVHELVEEFCASPDRFNPFYAGYAESKRKYSDIFRYSVKNFLGLLPYDKPEDLLSRKEKIFKYLETCSHTMTQVYFLDCLPADERLEVFDALDVLEFPKPSNHLDQIIWLTWMPRGKRQALWPICYRQAQRFAAKYPDFQMDELLNCVLSIKHIGIGSPFHPGLFSVVESNVEYMMVRWEKKMREKFPHVTLEEISRFRSKYLGVILPTVSRLYHVPYCMPHLIEGVLVFLEEKTLEIFREKVQEKDDYPRLPALDDLFELGLVG